MVTPGNFECSVLAIPVTYLSQLAIQICHKVEFIDCCPLNSELCDSDLE